MTPDTLHDRLSRRSDADLLDLLRARDTEQWREEVFPIAEGILRSRGIEAPPPPATRLVPEASAPQEPDITAPRGEFVTVATFPTVIAADACRSALTAAGFTVVVPDEVMLQQDFTVAEMYGWSDLACQAARRTTPVSTWIGQGKDTPAEVASLSGRRTTRLTRRGLQSGMAPSRVILVLDRRVNILAGRR